MQAIDFIYDDISLCSMGFMICDFDSKSSMDTVTSDSQKTFHNVSMYHGHYFPMTISEYEDRLEMQFMICKFDASPVTMHEATQIKRWLNRPDYHVLRFLDEELTMVYFEGSFNINEVYFSGERYGFELTFISNRPFGLYNSVTYTATLSSAESILEVHDTSDEIGYIYPDMVITCKSDGDLVLKNSFDGRSTTIQNCKAGEVIHISPELQISTSITSHDIQNDFNYTFLRISNDYHNNLNQITSSLNCQIQITYSPIAKVVVA